jgi:hypothetical protein
MSTVAALPVRPVEVPVRHITATRRYTWVCYQKDCDGVHHYWRRAL